MSRTRRRLPARAARWPLSYRLRWQRDGASRYTEVLELESRSAPGRAAAGAGAEM